MKFLLLIAVTILLSCGSESESNAESQTIGCEDQLEKGCPEGWEYVELMSDCLGTRDADECIETEACGSTIVCGSSFLEG